MTLRCFPSQQYQHEFYLSIINNPLRLLYAFHTINLHAPHNFVRFTLR